MSYTEKKREIVYAFIDSQNLNLGTLKTVYRNKKIIYKGWKLDFKKFRLYLRNKFRVEKAFLFIGYTSKNIKLYNTLVDFGYILIFKPTLNYSDAGNKKIKGNVDTELVLHCCRLEYDCFEKAVIVSGDGDFYCLYNFLVSEGKLKSIIIPNNKTESSLLKTFQKYKVYIWRNKNLLEKKRRA